MPSLLWRSYLRYLSRNLWLPLLCLCSIAVAVAGVLAIDLASVSSKRSFDLSTEALVGQATHQLLAPGGEVPEVVYQRLRLELAWRASAPIVEGLVTFPSSSESILGEGLEDQGIVLTLFGIDPLADGEFRGWTDGRIDTGDSDEPLRLTRLIGSRNEVVVSRSTAKRLEWSVGEERWVQAAGKLKKLRLAGLFRASTGTGEGALDNLVLADISTAQEVLERLGRLDRIDLRVDGESCTEGDLERLAEAIGPGYAVVPAGQSRRTARELSAAFHTNLQALSYLCLMVAGFLILNAVSFSVAHRQESLGRLRVLGVTSRQLSWLLLMEAAILGALGGGLGLSLGVLLGRGLVPLVSRTVNDLYYTNAITGFELDPMLLLKAWAWGLGVSVLAAAWPTWEASRKSPVELLYRVQQRGRNRRLAVGAGLLGVITLMAAGAVLLHPSLAAGIVSLFAFVLGASLLVPAGLFAAVALGVRTARSMSARMAWRGLIAYLPRTSLAAVALTVAVAATISISTMVHSFRGTLSSWLETTLVADVYVGPKDRAGLGRGEGAELPPELVADLIALPGVQAWVGQKVRQVPSSTGETVLVAVQAPERYSRTLNFAQAVEDPWGRFREGQGVFVTEPYAQRAELKVGSELQFATPTGEQRLPVLGVYYSYAPDRNLAMVSSRQAELMFGPAGWSSLALYLHRGASHSPEEQLESIRRLAGEELEVRPIQEIKSLALEIFERTFTITEVIRFLALAVAVIGVFLSLLALAFERTREVAVLRALGMERRQLFALGVLQSALLGALAALMAAPLGLLLAQVMIAVINRRAFGWTISFGLDPQEIAWSMGAAVLAALLAGIYPAWLWSRADQGESLRERE